MGWGDALLPAMTFCGVGSLGLAGAVRYSRYWPRLRRAVRGGWAIWRAAPYTMVQTGDEYHASAVVQVHLVLEDGE